MKRDFFVNNRRRFAERMEEDGVAILYSGQAPVKSNDQDISPFAVNRNFYYLTGIDTENVWLVLNKGAAGVTEMLFIDQPDEFLIKWNGWMLTCEQASERSGIELESVHYMQDLDRFVGGFLYNGRTLTSRPKPVYFSFDRLSMRAAATAAEQYANKIRDMYPAAQICNCAGMIASLRAVKAPEEVECIRHAGDVTMKALEKMLQSAKPGEYEYQWVADYEHMVARSGMRNAFTTIAASGANAVMLHYSDNNCIAEDGSLLLVDLGAEYGYYSSDVSRTFPVNGKYTDRQKELYGIVREAMDIARDKMRPGVAMRDSQQAVIDFYRKALRTVGLIRDDSEVGKYYYHGVSHSLGLDTHDPCDRTVYEPGMVITCEPGLYVKEEGIGIRLENDILVTEDSPVDLIGDRLLDMGEIERLMA